MAPQRDDQKAVLSRPAELLGPAGSHHMTSQRRTAGRQRSDDTVARRQRERAGRLAEWMAAFVLMLKGYRVLAIRERSRLGEVDLVAVRGRRLAFVEVKFRRTEDLAADAVGEKQARRIADCAEQWVWRHRGYRDYEIGLDSVLIVPWRLPRHLPNALQPS